MGYVTVVRIQEIRRVVAGFENGDVFLLQMAVLLVTLELRI
jgi:hypothetical protein